MTTTETALKKPEIIFYLGHQPGPSLRAAAALRQLRDSASHHAALDRRHPLGIYNVSTSRILKKLRACCKKLDEVDALDATITDLTSKIAAEKKVLQQHVPSGMTVEKFLALAKDPGIDVKISEQKTKISAASKSAEIAEKSLLKPQSIPSLSTDFLPALGKTVAAVSATVAQKVEEHLSKHKFVKDGQIWISTGLKHIEGDTCPFCANDLKGNALVELYGQFFDQTYNNVKAELVALSKGLQGLSEAAGLKAKAGFEELAKDVEYWNTFGKVEFVPSASLDGLIGTLAALHLPLSKPRLLNRLRFLTCPNCNKLYPIGRRPLQD